MPPLPLNIIIDCPTVAEGRRYLIPANSEIRFGGRAFPGHRKQIVITNRSASLNLQVRFQKVGREDGGAAELAAGSSDNGGPVGVTIFPQSVITLLTSAGVWIRNANGSDVYCDVAETFFAPP